MNEISLLVLFLIFSFGIMTGVGLSMVIIGRMIGEGVADESKSVEKSVKAKVFGVKRPNVQAAYKYSSPAYRKEREELRQRTKV